MKLKLILRTSIRTCKRCGTASRSEVLLEAHPTQPDGKIDRLVPYKAAFLPADLRLQDIERRTEVGPIAICSNCIDRESLAGSACPKGKIVHMNGRDYDPDSDAPPPNANRFVLSPAPREIKAKDLRRLATATKKSKGKEHFSLEEFMASI